MERSSVLFLRLPLEFETGVNHVQKEYLCVRVGAVERLNQSLDEDVLRMESRQVGGERVEEYLVEDG